MRRRRRGGEDGTILLPVILLLLLIATAATAMTLQARTSLREAATRHIRLSLALAADAAARATALGLATATADRAASPLPVDGTPQGCRLADGRSLVLSVQDEGGRIDLNKAAPELLETVLSRSGVAGLDATAMTDAIMARRGTGTSATPRRARETRPEKSYAAPSGGFAIADAIDALPGMQPGLFDRLRPLFTVSNGSAGIDPAVAAPAVRAVFPPKELASPAFEPMTAPSSHSDFTITATVGAVTGTRFQRQASLHLDAQGGPLGHITSWEAPELLGSLNLPEDGAFCRRVAAALGPD